MNEKKTKNDFEFFAPGTLKEALELIDRYRDSAKLMSGGTDFIPKMKALAVTPDQVIYLKNIKELSYIDYDCRLGLRIGAETPLKKVEEHPVVKEVYPALREGIHSMANTQIRNAGTITGNICNAVPSADTAPPLIVLDASVRIQSVEGERSVPIAEFFTGVCRTCLADNEIVTEIMIPNPEKNAVMKYYKSSARQALDLAIVGVATKVVLDKEGFVKDARIALGAVAVTPKRAYQAEEMLSGRRLTEELIEEAAAFAANQECAPISDIRASKEYRRELVRLSVRDGLRLAVN